MTVQSYWTNKSVMSLGDQPDPVQAISSVARQAILDFIESGASGPPFNQFELASFLRLNVSPNEDVKDARTMYKNGKFFIEFNPNRPRSRINYSIAHEISHTFFPNCKDEIRNRSTHEEIKGDDWQLEMLCNIGASELLMPIGSFPTLEAEKLNIDALMKLRKEFDVSTESLLLRFVRLTKHQCAVFVASRRDPDVGVYQVDYSISSSSMPFRIRSGHSLPSASIVSDCTAIGYTAKGNETWLKSGGEVVVECVGVPAYPGQIFPRVAGIVRPAVRVPINRHKATLVQGDATKPRGTGRKIVAFVVNDATPRWGAGFALVVRKKWPIVQDNFVRWSERSRGGLKLGNLFVTDLDSELAVAQLVCQHGYGASPKPRIRYASLELALNSLAEMAASMSASVHMPRIGSGQAGGNWSIISEMIDAALSRKGIPVTIYELPNDRNVKHAQQSLLFSA